MDRTAQSQIVHSLVPDGLTGRGPNANVAARFQPSAFHHLFTKSSATMTGWIGIALGDLTGIGPEVALKALAGVAATDDMRYLLIGDAAHLRRLNEQLHLQLPLEPYRGAAEEGRFFVHSPASEPLAETMSPGSPAAARAALTWLTD